MGDLGLRVPTAAVRPQSYLFQQCTMACLVLMAPIFGVLYWLTVPEGTWLPVAVSQAIVTVLLALGVLSYFLTAMWADDAGLTTRNHFGRRRTFPVEHIAGAVRLELLRSGSLTLQPQLFLLDAEGRVLTRMHGMYWLAEAMDTVIDALGVPVAHVPEPVTLRDLSRSRPELLRWFERPFARGAFNE